jgi:imidazole glycerol phosphate synthase subunit hisF (EC 4.1.3.-)
VVYRTAEQVFIPLTVGGGIQDLEMIKNLLRSGGGYLSVANAFGVAPRNGRIF